MPVTAPFASMRVAFVLDNSASMLQRTASGVPVLDIAKTFAESLVARLVERSAREGVSSLGAVLPRVDRCFLLTTDGRVRAGWGDSFAAFRRELRRVRAAATADVPAALAAAYALLAAPPRPGAPLPADARGGCCGGCPWLAEPAFVVLVTDGTAPAPPADDQLAPPPRWDQRLFVVRLAFPSEPANSSNSSDAPVADLPHGGKVFVLTDPAEMPAFVQGASLGAPPPQASTGDSNNQQGQGQGQQQRRVPSIVPYLYACVLVAFVDRTPGTHARRRTVSPLLLGAGAAHALWPLPTAACAGGGLPQIAFSTAAEAVRAPRCLPCDTYLLRDTQQRALRPLLGTGRAWPCWADAPDDRTSTSTSNNGSSTTRRPFGFLAERDGRLCLAVLPPDYAALAALVDEAAAGLRDGRAPRDAWHAALDAYLAGLPAPCRAPVRLFLRTRFGGALHSPALARAFDQPRYPYPPQQQQPQPQPQQPQQQQEMAPEIIVAAAGADAPFAVPRARLLETLRRLQEHVFFSRASEIDGLHFASHTHTPVHSQMQSHTLMQMHGTTCRSSR